ASGQPGGAHDVVPTPRLDDQLIQGPLRAGDVDLRVQTGHGVTGASAANLDLVGGVGAVDDDGIHRVVAGAASRRRSEVKVDLRDVGATEVADGDHVGAAQGVEVDSLDAVEVHRHAADIAGEAHVAAVGRDVDLLGDVGAVEEHPIVPRLAL